MNHEHHTMNTWLYIEAKRRKFQAFVIAAIVILFTLFISSRYNTSSISPNLHSSIHELGTGIHIENIYGQDVVWEFPQHPLTGIVFFAHGCHHSATDLWPPTPHCPHCLGLPEEVRLRNAVLRQNLVLIAISSLDRVGKRCWAEVRKDGGKNIAKILRFLLSREDLTTLPLYALGASSGGEMAMTLPRIMPEIKGVLSQVRSVSNDVLLLPDGRSYPPTVLIYMPRDDVHLPFIQENARVLRNRNVPVVEIEIHPRPVSVDFLSGHSELIDRKMAERIIDALDKANMLIAENNSGNSGNSGSNGDGNQIDNSNTNNNNNNNMMLVEPPRPATDRWAPFVQPVIGNLSLVLDESHVGELLNVAWAKHELISDGVEESLVWLKGGGKGRVELLSSGVEDWWVKVVDSGGSGGDGG